MAVVGTATLNVIPKFSDFKSSLQSQTSALESSGKSSGQKFGNSFNSGASGGILKTGAAVGAFSALTQTAMSALGSSVGDAVSRLDTLNNYPRVMESLGYSTQDAESSLQLMSDHLTGLPTALDDMVSSVQGLSTITGDLSEATDVGLALNDMLLASGSNTQVASAAAEQFRQMLSKGKPDMQDWKSLVSAMPGQMDQLAKSMLGTEASATDLYSALGGGGAEATISMEQLMAAMVDLDQNGSASFESFEAQARTASGGVQTSLENIKTAAVRGMADVMDAIGQDTISGTLGGFKDAVTSAFELLTGVAQTAKPIIAGIASVIGELAPQGIAAAAAFTTLSKATSFVTTGTSGLASGFRSILSAANPAQKAVSLLSSSINPLTAGLGFASVALVAGVSAFSAYRENTENAEKATSGLKDAVADTSTLTSFKQAIGEIGSESGNSALSMSELNESIADHVDKMNETNESAQTQISALSNAQAIISQYAGQSDLSADAQGRVTWAVEQLNEQLGLNISALDVMNGSYTDADGNVQDLKESILQLVDAKKQEIKQEALTENLSEAYEAQAEAAKTYAEKRQGYADKVASIEQGLITTGMDSATARIKAEKQVSGELDEAREAYENTSQAVSDLETQLGDAATSASDAADSYDDWGNSLGNASAIMDAMLEGKGGMAALKEDLRALGASTEDLGTLTQSQLEELAEAYDGTTSSIVGKLSEWGVDMDEAALASAEAVSTIHDSLVNLAEEVGVSFENIDISGFSEALAEAGVSTETLNQVGAENIAALAEAFGGNIDQMTWAIENFNTVPIVDKDGNVNVDDAQLIDAQGNIWTWNGSEFVSQTTTASVYDQSLTDAQGNVYTWNGTTLVSKSASAIATGNATDGSARGQVDNTSGAIGALSSKDVNVNANGNAADGSAASFIWNTVSAIGSLFSKTVQVRTDNITTYTEVRNAAGGIRPHAAGGFMPRYHAGGAIATQALPLDIVGEDGAEAIVPLTNRKYSEPFARTLAEQMFNASNANSALDLSDAAISRLADAIAARPVAVNMDSKQVGKLVTPTVDRQLGRNVSRGF